MKRILLTGNSGLLGSALLSVFQQKGKFDVIPFSSRNNTRDICNSSQCEEALDEIDGIIHLASCQPYAQAESSRYFRINTKGTFILRKLALEKGIYPFIFASSQDIYDEDSTGHCLSEDSPKRPLRPYAKSKYAAEYLLSCGENKGLSIFRLSVLAGNYAHKYSLINHMLDSAQKNGFIELFGRGERIYDFISVFDVANLFHIALQERFEGIFNLGINRKITTLDITKLIQTYTGCKIRFNSLRKEKKGCFLNCSKLLQYTKYRFLAPERSIKHLIKMQGIVR